MQLAAALKRVGATIAQEKITDAAATLYLRVDPDQGQKWVETVTEFLMGTSGKSFTADISKYSSGAGRSSTSECGADWRGRHSADALGACAIQVSVVHGRSDLDPFVGRAQYAYDPARGKLKALTDLTWRPAS